MAILLGLLVIISAVIILYELNFAPGLCAQDNLLLVPGLFILACGIFIIIKPLNATSVIFLATGIWLCIAGAIGTFHSFYKGHVTRADRWEFLPSLTILIFALLIFEDPAGVAVLLIYGAGVYLFLCGCLLIAVNIYIKKRRQINLKEINSYLPSFMRYAE